MATYTAASVALNVVPDLTGFFSELDARIRGYRPPPIPGPDIEPDVDTEGAEGEIEQSANSGGLAAAAVAAGVLIGAALSAAIGNALDLQATQSRLAAQLGDQNAIGAERAGKVAGQLYAGAYGGSMAEVSDAVSNVIRSGALAANATDEQIQGVTAGVLDLAAAFDVDTVRATESLSAMVRNNLVPNAEAGLDVITRLYQTLGPGADDVLDTFQEYSGQFAKVGIDAEIAGGLISQMFRAGARDTDIAADAIKEFSIRSIDGSKLTVASYEMIGLSADGMRKRIAAGGPDAQVAMGEVITALKGVEDPAVRAEAAVGLFGTQAEDLGAALYAMDPENAVDAMGGVAGAAADMGTILADNGTTKITEFQRGLEMGVAGVLNEHVIPAVEWFLTTMDGFLSIPAVPEVLGFLASMGASIAIVLGVIAGATWAWTAAQTVWNAVMAANPLTIVIVLLAALVGALIYAYNTSEQFRVVVDAVFVWIGEAVGRFGAAFQVTMDSVGVILDVVGDAFVWLWENAIKPVVDFIIWYYRDLLWLGVIVPVGQGLATAFGAVGEAFSALGGFFVWVFDNIIRPPFDAFPGFIDSIATGLGIAWDKIQKLFGSPVYFVLETVWNNGIGGLWGAAKGLGIPLGDFPRANTAGIPHFAAGGRVPGTSPTKTADDVIAALTAGEYVQPVASVDYYGADVMEAIRNRAIPRERLAAYAAGGLVNPVGPQQMHEMLRRHIPGTRLTSGRRPGDPGWHGRGLAGDFAGSRPGDMGQMRTINEFIASRWPGSEEVIYTPGINIKRGKRHTYSPAVQRDHYDHVHWAVPKGGGETSEVMEAGTYVVKMLEDTLKGAFDGMAAGVRALVPPRGGNFIADMPMNFADWGINKTKDLLFAKAREEDAKSATAMPTGGGGDGGGGVQQWRGVVLQALSMMGLSPSLADTTLRRMNQESGGNPRAINNWDSNAAKGTPSKGLMQVIDPTFRSNYDPRTPNDIWNPLSNIVASMRYVLRRYGSIPAGYNKKGGYDEGGELFPGITQVHNRLPHSETVIPLPPDLVNNLLAAGTARGSGPLIAEFHAHDAVDVDLVAQRIGYMARTGGM
jgi:hypothetical protein